MCKKRIRFFNETLTAIRFIKGVKTFYICISKYNFYTIQYRFPLGLAEMCYIQ